MPRQLACCKKVNDLADGVCKTCIKECVRIIAVAVYDALEVVGKRGAACGYHSLNRCDSEAGHDAGCDRYVDACDPRGFNHVEEITVIEEELRQKYISSCVYLLLKVADVGYLVRRFGMALGIACACDAEVCLGLNVLDKLACMLENVLRGSIGVDVAS